MKQTLLSKMFYATIMVALSITAAHAQAVISTVPCASLTVPYGVSTDVSGNIYVADYNNYSITMISASTGASTAIVPASSFDPDAFMPSMGGPAIDAILTMPDAIFVDASGNIFFTDWYNDAAAEISASTGHITNICGHETQGCTGDGGEAPLATMEIPGGIWVDHSGNVFIADYGNNRIRKITASTGVVNTIAGGEVGTGIDGVPALTAHFGQINGVCTDAAGNVYISDAGLNIVRKIDNAGIIRTVAGTAGVTGYTGDGGSSLSATLDYPGCLFINSSGDLFICDVYNNCVRVVNVNTGIINTLAGNGTAGYSGDGGSPTAAQLYEPQGVCQDGSGNIYIADAYNGVIRKITSDDAYYRTTGVNTVTQNNVTIFPNPCAGTITVQTSMIPDNGTLEVYNVLGEKVFTTPMDQEQATITLNQPAGVYTVILKAANGNTTQKITIEK